MPDLFTALGWIGRRLHDADGVRIGRVEDVFVDHGVPRWITVGAGRIRPREVAVAPEDIGEGIDGRLYVPYDRTRLIPAPTVLNEPGLVRAVRELDRSAR